MRILVTNDDGINADGLDVCAAIGRALSDDVWVVAPEFDQSGISHSLSLNDPLRLRVIGERRFAVKGTPTDCVIMAAKHLLKDQQASLVLSGVNRGRNTGEDVIYSGTVAGAVEGTILGIPSVALSQSYDSRSAHPPFWETAIRFAPRIIRRVLDAGIPREVLININFPNCMPDDVTGIAVTSQGRQCILLDRVRAQSLPSRRLRHRCGCDCRAPHRNYAATTRYDGRAIHDQTRAAVRLNRCRQRALQHPAQHVHLERLLQCWPVAIGFRQPTLAISGGEYEGRSARDQCLGHRRDGLPVEIDIEYRHIEFRGPDRRQRLVNTGRLGRDGVTELPQHVLEQHANHQFILDHEDAFRTQRSGGRWGHAGHGPSADIKKRSEPTRNALQQNMSFGSSDAQ